MKFQWIDRDGAIWYANEQLKQGFDMDTAIFASLNQKSFPYCKRSDLITKYQMKKLNADIQQFNLTGMYPHEFGVL